MIGTKCRGICEIHSVKSSSYQNGKLKRCTICDVFLENKHQKCPCCKNKISTKPKATKDKRSKEGDQALTFFDVAVIRTNYELKILQKCYKIPGLGRNIIDSILRNLYESIHQCEIIRDKKRQRLEYLDAKYKMIHKLIHRVEREINMFNASIIQ